MSGIFVWLGTALFIKGLVLLPFAPVLWPLAFLFGVLGTLTARD